MVQAHQSSLENKKRTITGRIVQNPHIILKSPAIQDPPTVAKVEKPLKLQDRLTNQKALADVDKQEHGPSSRDSTALRTSALKSALASPHFISLIQAHVRNVIKPVLKEQLEEVPRTTADLKSTKARRFTADAMKDPVADPHFISPLGPIQAQMKGSMTSAWQKRLGEIQHITTAVDAANTLLSGVKATCDTLRQELCAVEVQKPPTAFEQSATDKSTQDVAAVLTDDMTHVFADTDFVISLQAQVKDSLATTWKEVLVELQQDMIRSSSIGTPPQSELQASLDTLHQNLRDVEELSKNMSSRPRGRHTWRCTLGNVTLLILLVLSVGYNFKDIILFMLSFVWSVESDS